MKKDENSILNGDKDSQEFNLAYHNTVLENISSQFKVFGEGQIALTKKVDGLAEDLGTLKEKVNIIDIKLDVLTERVDVLTERVDVLTERMSNFESKMDKLSADMDFMKVELKEIKEQLKTKINVEEFSKLEQRVVNLEKLVSA